ncbi:hypothetical protein [Mesorhizobium sp. B2-4-18]|uniref:sunset domain-containing protein n=1 Tax=Mesorhizobium sp. B2-4-18 TaxID=2589931 RepID=UPI0015E368B5|nr:hypothetical protein [Mesorhizobium sp. B2-4-18]
MGKRYRNVADNRYNRRRYPRRADRLPWWAGILLFLTVLAIFAAVQIGPEFTSCNIKGNISYNTGERIYHVPGQEYYSETRISLLKGERWFCSEAEARAAGWRKSRV